MKKALAIVVGIILLLFIVGCGSQEKDTNKEGTEASSQATEDIGEHDSAPEEDDDIFVVEAAGLKLKYPTRWQSQVSVEVDTDKAAFHSGDKKLFTLFFNCPDEGNVLGTVCGDKNIIITVLDYEVSDEDSVAMQEDVNVILQHLIVDYDFVAGEAIVNENDDVFAIKTSVTTLYYPTKWQDVVAIKVSNTKVSFTYGNENLFDLVFIKTESGILLGTYEDTPIYVVDYEVSSNEACAMQEDINVILHYLMEDDNFSINS